MRVRNHGKYTHMRKNDPRGIALCDYSGLMVRHADLIRQMEYRGTGLVWTGFLVYKKFADKPNAQNLTPLIKLDPVPLPNSRPDSEVDAQTTIASSTGALTLDVSGNANVILTEDQFDNGSLTFTGALTGDIIIQFPNTFNQFYANNLTTGDYTLGMQSLGNLNFVLTIPAADSVSLLGPMVVNTTTNLQFVYF
jgi:hypothetical protein